MRTEAQADKIVRTAISDQTGAQVPDGFFLNFSRSETGQLSALFIKKRFMIGMDIAPAKFWKTFKDEELYSLPVHEMQNARHDLLPIEKRKIRSLMRLKALLDQGVINETAYRQRRLARLVYWEVTRHSIEASTQRKLHVDLDTFRELKRLGKNPKCFLRFLLAEKQEEQQRVQPPSRNATHLASLELRIRHYMFLCNGAYSHASRLRKQQYRQYELTCTL